MEDRINELEMTVSLLKEQIKALQIDMLYLQKVVEDNCVHIKQEEHGKILA